MRKTMLKALCLITAALMLAAVIPFTAFAKTAPVARDIWDGSVAEGFAGGSGTAEDPYLISSGAELAYLAEQVNAGEGYDGCFFEMTQDICLNDTEGWEDWSAENAPANMWIPVGGTSVYNEAGFPIPCQFCGSFNGNGYTVSGAYFYTNRDLHTHPVGGVFGRVRGEVTDLNVRDSKFIDEDSGTPLGAVVAYAMSGTVRNCTSNSIVIGTDTASGIVGVLAYDGGRVENCINTGSVSGWLHVGGIVGNGNGLIENCRNEGSIGQIAEQDGIPWAYGGIAGYFAFGTIRNCTNTGSVSANASGIGGIVGTSDDGAGELLTIECCCNEGSISGGGAVGGIIGWDGDSYTNIENCYNRGAISGEMNIGGLVGTCYAYGTCAYVNCYNAGAVSGTENVHPFIGRNVYEDHQPNVENCYYLDTCCEAGDEYAEALTDEQLRLEDSYEGFDFETVWTMEGDPDYPYAELTGQAPAQLLPGDVDGDGEVTVADALLALRASMGLVELDEAQQAAANVDGDEEITVADALLILRASMGLLEL